MPGIAPHEQALINAVGQAVSLTSGGMKPTEAIEKVAADGKLGPEMILRVAQAFNKAYSYHMLKEAAPKDRAKFFDIADPRAVIQRIFKETETQKVASKEPTPFSLPYGDFTKDMFASKLEKTAEHYEIVEERYGHPGPDSYIAKLGALAYDFDKAAKRVHEDAVRAKFDFDRAMDRVVEEMLPMTDVALNKVAQNVVNGHGKFGSKFVRCVFSKIRRNIPDLQKTANAVVFPATSPYFSIGQAIDAAYRLVHFQGREEEIAKEAGMISQAVKQVAAQKALSATQTSMDESAKIKELGFHLDPAFANRLRALEARRNFFVLAAYAPEMKPFRFDELVDAYNNAVQMVPEAAGNVAVLKNLMLRNLESSGVMDPFEITQQVDISKKMGEVERGRKSEVEKQLEDIKKSQTPAPVPSVSIKEDGKGSSVFEAVSKNLGEAAKGLREVAKENPEGQGVQKARAARARKYWTQAHP